MFAGKPSQEMSRKQLFTQLNSYFNGRDLVTPEVYLQNKPAIGTSFASGIEILCILHIRFMYELGKSRFWSRNSQKQRQTKNVVTEQVLSSSILWRSEVKPRLAESPNRLNLSTYLYIMPVCKKGNIRITFA
jgi:hypothetical protein